MYIAITASFYKGIARTEYWAIGHRYPYPGLNETDIFHSKPDFDVARNATKAYLKERLREKEDVVQQSPFQQHRDMTSMNHGKVRGQIDRFSEKQISTIGQITGSLQVRRGNERLLMPRLG